MTDAVSNKGVFDAGGNLITPEMFASKLSISMPYFKASVGGFAGSGKSFFSAEMMAGIYKLLTEKKLVDPSKPLVCISTEDAVQFLIDFFEKRGVPVVGKDTRSLADVQTAILLAEQGHYFGVYIDSATHVYKDFIKQWMIVNKKPKMEMRDYGITNPLWEEEFGQTIVRAKTHIIFTGRGTADYSMVENEQTGKSEMQQTGVKMQISKDAPFDPNLVVWMSQMSDKGKRAKTQVWYEAFILKDRSDTINGKTFGSKKTKGPTWKDVSPHFTSMLKHMTPGAVRMGQTTPATAIIPGPVEKDNTKDRKAILLDEIKSLLSAIAPGRSDADTKTKCDLMERAFGSRSAKKIETFSIQELEAGMPQLNADVDLARRLKNDALKAAEATTGEAPPPFDNAAPAPEDPQP